MTVTSLAPAAQTGTPKTDTTTPKPATSTDPLIDSDFETFLKMLTTQLQNQDPMDPIDNSEYAVQLATFSGVEQQVKTNNLLEGLGSQLGVMGLSQLAGWVGQQARADMPVWVDGTPVTLAVTPDARAGRSELVVTNGAGTVVAREPVPLGTENFTWTGTGATGTALPEGRYALALESFAAGTRLGSTPVESYAEIQEARATAGATTLVFKGGIEVPSGKVTALRPN